MNKRTMSAIKEEAQARREAIYQEYLAEYAIKPHGAVRRVSLKYAPLTEARIGQIVNKRKKQLVKDGA